MKLALLIATVGLIGTAFLAVALTVRSDAAQTPVATASSTHVPTAGPTPLPATWIGGLVPRPAGISRPVLLSCLDNDANGLLNEADNPLFAGVEFTLVPEASCARADYRADWYRAPAPRAFGCGRGVRPLYLVAIAGGGSDLLYAGGGDSLGILDIVNTIRQRADAAGVPIAFTLSSGAVVGAHMAQTSLEELLEAQLSAQLDAVPCARAVLIGHSHGGVTVSSVTTVLDSRYWSRVLGVMVDRTNIIYDRPAENFPEQTLLLNFFQTNEGWHGEAIGLPNVVNFDSSAEQAPIAPADGGGGIATVRHRSLDDSPAVQQRIVDAVMWWLALEP
jgi:pimeloyl-ACP methyl ester carboxylesterase